ncbi:MAG: type II toxin-antitoxin system ParD family antitoxin [Aureliella sp.]
MIVNIPDELASFVDDVVTSGQFDSEEHVVGEALRLLKEQQVKRSVAKKRRGGQLRGRVVIADDFDQLPSEIAGAFGMECP